MSGVGDLGIWLESRLENVSLAGPVVLETARRAGFSHDQAYLLQLAVVEAANNAVLHAYGGRPDNSLEIHMFCKNGLFVLEVSDQGEAMSNTTPPQLEFDPQDFTSLPEGGMGLYLIHMVCDQVDYISSNGRNTLRMRKALPFS